MSPALLPTCCCWSRSRLFVPSLYLSVLHRLVWCCPRASFWRQNCCRPHTFRRPAVLSQLTWTQGFGSPPSFLPMYCAQARCRPSRPCYGRQMRPSPLRRPAGGPPPPRGGGKFPFLRPPPPPPP